MILCRGSQWPCCPAQTSLKMLYWTRLVYQFDEVLILPLLPSHPIPPLLPSQGTQSFQIVCPCECASRQSIHAPWQERTSSSVNLETAMGLYGLTDFQLLWERSTDTKCALMPQ